MADYVIDPPGFHYVHPEAGGPSYTTQSSLPRKRKVDSLLEESGIDMTTALSFLPLERDSDIRTLSDTSLGTSTFPFNQNNISQNPWGPQQHTIDPLIDACMAPLARIRDDLVKLYFVHVHPVCPVVDEYTFITLYRLAKNDVDLSTYVELPLLQAMLFTALAHVNQPQLDQTPYKSIHEAQKAHFDFTRALYRLQVCTKPYVLAQVTVLLTFWSPCDTELQVNSFWLDRAYYHAREAAVWNAQTSAGNPGDRRAILWWCCLIRDRMLATGMRRPHRLHQTQNVRAMLKEEDFGLEALLPSYSSRDSKKRMISVFLAFCRLSEIQADLAEYQSRFRFSRQWETATSPGISESEEMPSVTKFETRLKEWKRVFAEECRPSTAESGDNVYASTVCLVRLIASGLLLILYQPYLQWWSSVPFEAKNLWELSLRKLKEGTQEVLSNVHQLVATASLEAVPAFITSWITLPTAIYCTLNHVKVDSPHLPLVTTGRHVLPALLKAMIHRCQGAEFASILINECIEERSSGPTKSTRLPDTGRSPQEWDQFESSALVGDMPASISSTRAEAILLSRVARNIDSGLANDVSEKIVKVRNSMSPQTENHVKESVEAAHPATNPVSDTGEGDSMESPRALIKYMALYKEIRVLQSAAIFMASTRFNLTDILNKTAAAAKNFAAKRGQTASQTECRATISNSQERKGLEVEIDMEGDHDWEAVASIVSEWWLTQKKRHIVVNLVVNYT